MTEVKKFTPKGEDEIREEVIEEYDLDPENEDHKTLIDKAVKRELNHQNEIMESQKKLSKAIEQKKNYREKAQKALEDEDIEEELDDNGKPKSKEKDNPNKSDKDTDKFLTKEEARQMLHRQKYPNLTDEEYQSISALAKANEKSFEDTLENNPIVKSYFADSEAKQRLSGAIKEPSSRTNPTKIKTEEEKIADELDSDLPPGFSSEKK